MSWNHRVIRQTKDGEDWFGIHEVYYKGETPETYTVEAVVVDGEDVAELRLTLERMLMALDKPILTPADFDDPT